VTGKPVRVGGLPGRREATGRGVAHVTRMAAELVLGSDIKGHSVAIQGFGNVGSWAASFLHEAGARIVAISDVDGAIYDDSGLPIPELLAGAQAGASITAAAHSRITNEELLTLPVDVLIPAAVEGVFSAANADQVRAKLIVEAANDPTTPEANAAFVDKGIAVMPDILANAGGVIASYVEWRKGKSGSITDEQETYDTIETQLSKSFAAMVEIARRDSVSYRLASHMLAVDEVVKAMTDRQWV
jgi:glutamate dehydrogenase/leucine dehydrogenase